MTETCAQSQEHFRAYVQVIHHILQEIKTKDAEICPSYFYLTLDPYQLTLQK